MKKTNIKKTLSNKIKGICNGSSIRGITLISLVVTIVVFIILAVVIIKLSLGNNGIFNSVKIAKEKYQNAELAEQVMINEINITAFRDLENNSDLISRIQKLEDDNLNLSREISTLKESILNINTELEALSDNRKIKITTLWSGSATNGNTVILSQSYKNFDILYFYFSYRINDCYCIFPSLTSTIETYSNYGRGILYTTYDAEYLTLKFNSETSIKLTSAGGNNNLLRIVGVKFE